MKYLLSAALILTASASFATNTIELSGVTDRCYTDLMVNDEYSQELLVESAKIDLGWMLPVLNIEHVKVIGVTFINTTCAHGYADLEVTFSNK